MTAISAANLTRLRTTRHATRLGLCVYAPATIWTGQVNGAQSQGSTSITVDNVVQVSAPARHYQVLFGSSAGASDYGEARFRSYGAPTLVVAPHNAQLPNDAFITIKEWVRPTALHVEIDATDVVFEDGNHSPALNSPSLPFAMRPQVWRLFRSIPTQPQSRRAQRYQAICGSCLVRPIPLAITRRRARAECRMS